MANQEHLDLLKRGVKHWNKWRQEQRDIRLDLTKNDLSFANLSRVNLTDADFTEVNLIRTNLIRTDLINADLSKANLVGTFFNGANLTSTNLRGANLNKSNLTDTNLRHVSLSGTIFANNDLSMIKGLLEIRHEGPSLVQLHTIKLPQDGSASHFLRGTGVPDEWIDFYRTTMMYPIQYHSLFISYSSKDEMLAHRLHADLQDRGVRCWFAPEDIKIGDKIRARIDEAIHLQDKLLLLLSKYSIQSSWVEDEVEVALEKERGQKREVLFPIRLDELVMQSPRAWAVKVRTRHIGNFTCWTDLIAYQQAFERLLRDLKRESNTEGETDGKPGAS